MTKVVKNPMSVENLESELRALKEKALADFAQAKTSAALEELRLQYLGQKGSLSTIMRGLSSIDKAERPRVGQLANEIKQEVEGALDKQKDALYRSELDARLKDEGIDVTLPGRAIAQGHLHPLTQVTDEIISIFYGMGYEVAEGPEVETDY